MGTLTAERIYRNLKADRLGVSELLELGSLFHRDGHERWGTAETLEVTAAQWKKLSERIKADLKSFSQDKNSAESIEENLKEATREHYDYAGFLKKIHGHGRVHTGQR